MNMKNKKCSIPEAIVFLIVYILNKKSALYHIFYAGWTIFIHTFSISILDKIITIIGILCSI